MPVNDPVQQDQQNQPEVLTAEQAQAIWDQEAATRVPGYVPPTEEDVLADPDAKATDKQDETPAAKPAAPAKKAEKQPDAAKPDDPIAKRFDALEQTLKRTEGRVAAMQQAADKAAKAAAAAGEKAPTQAAQAAALKTPEKWAALQKEFPEWADATEELLRANREAPGPAGLTEDDVAKRVAAELQAREIARIERKHKGWLDTIKTDEFLKWRDAQPEEIKALGASDLAEDAIDMLDLFTKSRAPTTTEVTQQRTSRLAAAASTQRVSRTTQTARDDSELSPKEIWQQEAAKRAKAKAASA